MIQLIPFFAVAALLFLSLFFAMRRKPRAEGGSAALVEARQALNTLQVGLLPPELIGRIFAQEDLEYVVAEAPAGVHKLFLNERKRIALSWVDQVRSQVVSLRRFHLGAARFYTRLSLRTETALALNFAALILACRALQVLIYVWGPYAAPRVVGATLTTAARVCTISEESLAFMSPAQFATIGNRSAGSASL
ncbi:MAG TPA: hypothetical protein VJO53_05620 [Candidatus Acidoferrales bacterium]|nr:hypothetical protein [Candidatus Acidoferrales bacterium]